MSGWQTPYFPLDLYIEEISKRGRDWMPLMVCLLSVHEALDHSLVPQIHFTAHIIPNSPLTYTLSLRARISACSFWEQTKIQSIEETFISLYSSLLLPDLNIIWIIHIRKRFTYSCQEEIFILSRSHLEWSHGRMCNLMKLVSMMADVVVGTFLGLRTDL